VRVLFLVLAVWSDGWALCLGCRNGGLAGCLSTKKKKKKHTHTHIQQSYQPTTLPVLAALHSSSAAQQIDPYFTIRPPRTDEEDRPSIDYLDDVRINASASEVHEYLSELSVYNEDQLQLSNSTVVNRLFWYTSAIFHQSVLPAIKIVQSSSRNLGLLGNRLEELRRSLLILDGEFQSLMCSLLLSFCVSECVFWCVGRCVYMCVCANVCVYVRERMCVLTF
jgi:hypothetical protein